MAQKRIEERTRIKRLLNKNIPLLEEEHNFYYEKQSMKKKKKPPVNSQLKVRFNPTEKQKEIFKQWFGTKRLLYNRTVSGINESKFKVNFQSIRNELTPENKVENDWELNTPKDVRADGILDAVTAFKSSFSNLRNGNITNFSVGFKSKKKETKEVMTIPRSAINVLNDGAFIYKKYISEMIKINNKKDLKWLQDINFDIKILRYKYINKWFLLIPRYIFNPTENQGEEKMVAMDPGVRTFLTAFDPNNKVYKFGDNDMARKISPLFVRLDRLQSYFDLNKKNLNRRKKFKIKRKLHMLRYKIKNKINDTHYKVACFLCRNYNIIILPEFQNQQMAQSHKLGRKTNRSMLTWSHCNFLRRLKSKATQYPKCIVISPTEEYTSKTCTNCGYLHNNLGSNKIFNCPECNLVIDRDINGARNIFLKAIKD